MKYENKKLAVVLLVALCATACGGGRVNTTEEDRARPRHVSMSMNHNDDEKKAGDPCDNGQQCYNAGLQCRFTEATDDGNTRTCQEGLVSIERFKFVFPQYQPKPPAAVKVARGQLPDKEFRPYGHMRQEDVQLGVRDKEVLSEVPGSKAEEAKKYRALKPNVSKIMENAWLAAYAFDLGQLGSEYVLSEDTRHLVVLVTYTGGGGSMAMEQFELRARWHGQAGWSQTGDCDLDPQLSEKKQEPYISCTFDNPGVFVETPAKPEADEG